MVQSLTERNDRCRAVSVQGCARDPGTAIATLTAAARTGDAAYTALEGHQQNAGGTIGNRFRCRSRKLLQTTWRDGKRKALLQAGPPIAVILAITGITSHFAMVSGAFLDLRTGVKDDEMMDALINILMDGVRGQKS